MTSLRDRLGLTGHSDGAFPVAQRAVEALRSASHADPVEAAKSLAAAFDLLRNDLDLAAARGEDDTGVSVLVTLEGAEAPRRAVTADEAPARGTVGQLATA